VAKICVISAFAMRTFGGFRSGNRFFYGELRGEKVHELAQPYWIDIRATGQVLPLANVRVGLPIAPSKLIAVGLNYADHVAEMKRTELGTPLIWFKSPSSAGPRKTSLRNPRSILFSVTRSLSISLIAIYKRARNSLAAANRSIRTRQSVHLCMPMSM